MKKIKFAVFSLLIAGTLFTACEKIDPPVITMHELGHENGKTVERGEDLHIDAEIVADGKIQTVRIDIHPEDHAGGHEDEWEVDETFTKFEGQKNADFHEHFEVPADAEAGHYHFALIVTDQEGNTIEYEDEIEVLE